MATFRGRVYRAVDRIPYGRVATYGDIAALAGNSRAARAVGTALRGLPDGATTPWWRVVGSGGDIALSAYGGQLQRVLLVEEGVAFRSGRRVDLERSRWDSTR